MKNTPENIAFVVGTGAVENAWKPILDVVNTCFDFAVDSDGANCYFARLIYLLRFYKACGDPTKLALNELIQYVNDFKTEISNALSTAQSNGLLKPRSEFTNVLNKFILSEVNKTILISTNWDTVIDDEINLIAKSNHPRGDGFIESIHIHGSIKTPGCIYLPSEIVEESYRNYEDRMSLGTIHGSVFRALEEANITILYGLSLDPLDAELSQTLAVGWSSLTSTKIIIINPEHSKVAQRVKLLIDTRYPVNIIGFCPSNLEREFQY